jgi:ubiquinone/menaquinone biosynthesis C-methylase UbiE/uncharacterized protein YbaR (Trm112 family)
MSINLTIPDQLLSSLVCPTCQGALKISDERLVCGTCQRNFEVEDGIPILMPDLSGDIQLSLTKWDGGYKDLDFKKYIIEYKELYFADTVRQIEQHYSPKKNDSFLEIGCGAAFLGTYFAKKEMNVFGLDISITALKKAKDYYHSQGLTNAFFVCGCINQMPFRSQSFDLIYGGGVIEHLADTEGVVRELYRTLKPGGRSINAVPYLNLGSLTYRQIWGDIPHFPVLKQVAEFVHIKVLKAKHMVFGYGLSFSANFMKKVHKKAGFKDVIIGKWDAAVQFKIIPWAVLRRFCAYLANHSRLFWPMIKIVGIK